MYAGALATGTTGAAVVVVGTGAGTDAATGTAGAAFIGAGTDAAAGGCVTGTALAKGTGFAAGAAGAA